MLNDLKTFLDKANAAMTKAAEMGLELTPALARGTMQGFSLYSGPSEALRYEKRLRLGDGPAIDVDVFSPDPDHELPVLVYFHGGGHVCGSNEQYTPIYRRIANAAHCIVVAVDYRLAPEHRYPAGLQDCYRAVCHYRDALREICYGEQLLIGGDSAGGALSATLAARQDDSKLPAIDKQILIYPSLDYSMAYIRRSNAASGFLLEERTIDWYFDQYFEESEDRKAASPLFMSSPLPSLQTLIVTAGHDPLYPESVAYIDKLKADARAVEHLHFDDSIHGFLNLQAITRRECEACYARIGEFINR